MVIAWLIGTFDPAGTGPGRAGARPGSRPGRDGGTAADRPRTARHRGAQHRHHRDPGRLGPQGLRRPPRRGARRPGRHRGHQQGDAVRTAADGDRAAARRARSPGRGRRRWARRPAWPTSSGWPPRPWTRACRSTWTGSAAGSRSRPTSTCRRSASSRRRSPTWSATPAPASARSAIGQQDGQLSIEVTDSGRGGSAAGTGYGITGMRERAALLGGDFSAGPRPGGGFRVTARLPLPAPASAR